MAIICPASRGAEKAWETEENRQSEKERGEAFGVGAGRRAAEEEIGGKVKEEEDGRHVLDFH